MSNTVAQIAVEGTALWYDTLYSYFVPDKLLSKANIGSKVIVQFGKSQKKRQGVIFDITQRDDISKLKPIDDIPDDKPVLNGEGILLAKWMKETVFCTYYDGVKIQLPKGINLKIKTTYLSVSEQEYGFESEKEKAIFDFLQKSVVYVPEEELFSSLNINSGSKELKRLISAGKVIRNYDFSKSVKDATMKVVNLNVSPSQVDEVTPYLTEKQSVVMNLLFDLGSASLKEICYFTGYTSAVIKSLEKQGYVTVTDAMKYRRPVIKTKVSGANLPISLTDEQQKAYEGMLHSYETGGGTELLFGVTGSGKTSVYMKLIDKVIEDKKGIIVMVPEIALTPKLTATFKARYGDNVAVFHSGLSLGERYDEWKRIKNRDAFIAVGTRSAVFAPFENIGLIIVDEEQEHTYKSEQNPRFHAVDVAKFRAKYHKALLVLASATPNINTYAFAVKGRYGLRQLKHRYGNAVLPEVITVDMRKEMKNGNHTCLSSLLCEKLEENLKNKHQSILLINRRGFNTFAVCDSCQTVRTCPSCSVSLCYHADNKRLMCHSCGYSEPMSDLCPQCNERRVRFSGTGTQKVEEELKAVFPTARVVRMDTDSTLTRFAHEDKLNAFATGEYDILLGTQMVAKGLDFENVTLVGVLSADFEMYQGDYLSAERAFDLLTQVVGRAGRGEKRGLAVIQTVQPDSSVIRLAKNQDYEAFFRTEIDIRKYMIYPPYCDMCSITFSDETESKALACARCFVFGIEQGTKEKYTGLKLIVLGPIQPKIGKVNGKYKYRIIIKCINNKEFRGLLRDLVVMFNKNSDFSSTTLSLDMNPLSLY